MKTSRSILNELKWKPGTDFSKVEVDYIHRGAPGDVATVSGNDIAELGAWAIEITKIEKEVKSPTPDKSLIPYHRIIKIKYNGKTIFARVKED